MSLLALLGTQLSLSPESLHPDDPVGAMAGGSSLGTTSSQIKKASSARTDTTYAILPADAIELSGAQLNTTRTGTWLLDGSAEGRGFAFGSLPMHPLDVEHNIKPGTVTPADAQLLSTVGGCNDTTRAIYFEGNTLKALPAGHVFSTYVGCDEELAATDKAFTDFLISAPKVYSADGSLYLVQGKQVKKFVRA